MCVFRSVFEPPLKECDVIVVESDDMEYKHRLISAPWSDRGKPSDAQTHICDLGRPKER